MTEWRIIPGHENYGVSEDGQVKRITRGRGATLGRVLRLKKSNKGYWYYRVSLSSDDVITDCSVHRLVALAFIGPQPSEEHEVAHHDNNPLNNHFSNLRWATHRENMMDKERHGTVLRGFQCWKARLNEVDFERINDLNAAGISATKIGKYLGISQTYVSSLLRGKYRQDLRLA